MKELLAFIGAIVMITLSSTWYGYVLSVVWGWYVTPALGAPRLSIPAAIGVAAVIKLITHQRIEDKSEEVPVSQRWSGIFVRAFFMPAFTLLFCWIVKFWM